MNHPLTDAYFNGPCELFPNRQHRQFCREMESGLRAEIEQLQDKLKIAVAALEWCHNYARPDLIISDEVTGPALKAINGTTP